MARGLADRLQGWARFRDVLVHAYLDVDMGIVWDVLQNDLGDIEEFIQVAGGLLGETS